MSILDLQRGIAEAGRIRIGHQVPTGGGRTRPAKLESFRLTSSDKLRIEQAADLFGGEVKPWQAPAGPQWEVITGATAIDVVVPPAAMAFSQWYELWSAGGCSRRCDGQTELLTDQECLCDPAERACDMHTRLSVMIRDLPGLALWRIDTQGWYAGREIAGAVEVLGMAAARGVMLPARLLLDQRTVKRPGKDGKPQTLRFPVPRLDLGITPGELLLAGPVGGATLPQLADGERPKLLPVPRDESPVPSIADQSAPPAARPTRANAAPEIPASGRTRNSVAKREGDPGYWRARTFAEGAERGLDADALRPIAAQMVEVDEDEFSLSSLDEPAWERLFNVVLAFENPTPAAPAPATSSPGVADDAAGEPAEPESVSASTSALGGWDDDEPVEAQVREEPSLVEAIRTAVEGAKGKRVAPSPELKADVRERVLAVVGSDAFMAVVTEAVGAEALAKPTAAVANGLLIVADSFASKDELAARFAETAAAINAA